MAAIIDLADAVVAELNSAIAPQPGDPPPPPLFIAARAYAPVVDLGEMTALHVTVVPKAATAERLDRTLRRFDYSIDVAVQQKLLVGDGGEPEADGLMDLVERIGDHFFGLRLPELGQAVCFRVETDPIYSPNHMRELGQFTAVLTLVFSVVR